MKCITGQERIDLIAQIEKRIAEDTQVIASPERTQVWQDGWAEALSKFKQHPVVDSLIPAFVRPGQPIRCNGDFYAQEWNENEELAHYRLMQEKIGDWLFECGNIAEFGCGTGFNLFALAERFPDKIMLGFDFAQSAVDLVSEAGWSLQKNITAHKFDMLDPWMGMSLHAKCGVFTYGAIEQLAGNFKPFMEYLIAQRPKIVVHVEPVIELLDPANEVDALAIRFMKKRGYTSGLLPWLQSDSRMDILEVERSRFGSLMIEGHNLIAWRPRA